MADRKPLVLADGKLKELPNVDDLDIPLEDRFQELRHDFGKLLETLMAQGIEVPEIAEKYL